MSDRSGPLNLGLSSLISNIEEELAFVVKRYSDVAPKLLGRLVAEVPLGWVDVRRAFVIAEEMANKLPEEGLAYHGLSGEQLIARTDLLWFARHEVHDAFEKFPKTIDTKAMRSILMWFLDVLDGLLESLALVIPPLGEVAGFNKQVEAGLGIPDVLEESYIKRSKR